MEFIYATGNREKYFKAKNVGDCVVRAICNATGKDYMEVYKAITELSKKEKTGSKKKGISSARNGVYKTTNRRYIEGVLGWKWVSTMQIGSGCTTHMKKDELPSGILIVKLSKHLTCVIDGVIYDTYDCSRDEDRCVYGYWTKQ